MADTAVSEPTSRARSSREAAIAVVGAGLGILVLLASWWIYPAFTFASISSPGCEPTEGSAIPLYSRGGAALYVTGGDILRPDRFAPTDNAIDAVVLGYEVDGDLPGMPTWNLQVLRALRLEDPYGKRLEPLVDLGAVDTSLRDQWGSQFPLVPGLPGAKTLRAGEGVVFALPSESSYAQRSKLKAIIPVGIGRAADPKGTTLAHALSALNVLPDGAPMNGFAISYVRLASTQNTDSDIAKNFGAMLAAVDQTFRRGSFKAAVIGTWAKTPQQAASLVRGFCLAWSEFKTGLSADAGTLAHGALRLPAVGVVAAFLGALRRRDPMTIGIAIAYFLVIGGALAVLFSALQLLAPIIEEFVPPAAMFTLQFAIAAVGGWYLRRLAGYDPRRLVVGGASK